jgi:Leucine-rich repeat (LRR) protein
MIRALILLFFTVISTQVSFAAKKTTLKLNGKGITDVSDLKVPNRIRTLQLSSNSITSLEGLVLPTRLRFLDLDRNLITSLDGLEINESLERLEITSNPTIEDYSKLAEFQNIKELTIGLNALDEDNFDLNLINESINELVLGGNVFKEIDLSRFVNLHKLNIKGMFPFSRGSTEFLLDYSKVQLPNNLKNLLMGGNDFGDEDYTGLVLPDNLVELDMATAFITQEELKTLKLPANLKKLRLKRNNISSLDDIELPESLELLNLQLNPLTKEEKQKIKARFSKKVKVVFNCAKKCSNSP